MRPHPANNLPPFSAARFEEFKADIAANGLIEPVWILDGKILDGVHRWRACSELGLACPTREVPPETDPVVFSKSANAHRRHLTRAEHRKEIDFRLACDLARSDRAIAEEVGVGHAMVASRRRIATGRIDQSTSPLNSQENSPGRVGRDGQRRRTPAENKAALDAAFAANPHANARVLANVSGASWPAAKRYLAARRAATPAQPLLSRSPTRALNAEYRAARAAIVADRTARVIRAVNSAMGKMHGPELDQFQSAVAEAMTRYISRANSGVPRREAPRFVVVS